MGAGTGAGAGAGGGEGEEVILVGDMKGRGVA